MTNEIPALQSAVAVTPNDPDHSRRGQQPPKRRRPIPPEAQPDEPSTGLGDRLDPPLVGTRLNVRA
jgi:hypothetical protein